MNALRNHIAPLRAIALISMFSLLMSAFPAAFFVAEAASTGVILNESSLTTSVDTQVNFKATVTDDGSRSEDTVVAVSDGGAGGSFFTGTTDGACNSSTVDADNEFPIDQNKGICYSNSTAGDYTITAQLLDGPDGTEIGTDATVDITVEDTTSADPDTAELIFPMPNDEVLKNGDEFVATFSRDLVGDETARFAILNASCTGSRTLSAKANQNSEGQFVLDSFDLGRGFLNGNRCIEFGVYDNDDNFQGELASARVPFTFVDEKTPEPDPEPEETVDIVATKIVCTDESLLPNGGYQSIDADTAEDFLADLSDEDKSKCAVAKDWQFQTALGEQNPQDDNTPELGDPWVTSAMTDSNGQVTVSFTEDDLDGNSTLSVREVLKDNFLPFSGTGGSDVTAEIYCANDAGNYDNLEWIPVELDNTYHCVAWNVAPEEPETPQCTVTIVSDETNTVEEKDDAMAEILSTLNDRWTAVVANPAKWIWGDDPVEPPTTDSETQTFVKQFGFNGVVTNASLTVAADNEYVGTLNDNEFANEPDEVNYTEAGKETYDVTGLIATGNNELTFAVKNQPLADSNPETNPAGLLYNLTITGEGENCEVPYEEELEQCVPESNVGADSVVSYDQGTKKDGDPIADHRDDQAEALGEADWVDGTEEGFVSLGLGLGGEIVLSYDNFVIDTAGDDITVFEATNGEYPAETADVFISQTGDEGDWTFVGVASNAAANNQTNLDIAGTGLSWFKFVQIVDTTDDSLHDDDADGFDVDAAEVAQTVCEQPEDPVEKDEVATIVASKIVCTDETELPNYSDVNTGGPNLDADSAQNWVDTHNSCNFASDWEFEWAVASTQNPDDDLPENPFYGAAGGAWSMFDGATNASGTTEVELTAEQIGDGEFIWVREALQEGFIPFTYGPGNATNEDNVSAEMYCSTDVRNYDNYDRVDGITVDNTYYCVAWNSGEEDDNGGGEEPLTCTPGKNLLANGDFEAPTVTNAKGWDIFADGTSGLGWSVEWVNPVDAPDTASLELQAGVNGWLPAAGAQHAELDGDYGGPTSDQNGESAATRIAQLVPTIDGAEYTLSWEFSARPGTVQTQNKLSVEVDNSEVANNQAANQTNQTEWQKDSYTFDGTGADMEIAFADLGKSDSRGTLLDNASLTCDPAPTAGPYCGDGVVNQWEQCEVGDDNCTDSCTLQNQCTDLRLVKISLDEEQEQTSFDNMIYLGSSENPIPNNTWFNFDEAGDDALATIGNNADGLAVERDTDTNQLLVGFRGDNDSGDLDIAQGTIMTKGIDFGGIDREPNNSYNLEDSTLNPRAFEDVFEKDDDTMITFDMRADTGNDGAAVDIATGDVYNCPVCKAGVEARIVLQDGEAIANNGDGNLSETVILGDGSEVNFGDWFSISAPISPEGSAVFIDDDMTATNYNNPETLEGLFVSREGNGEVKVVLYGEHNPGGDTNYESLRATIEFRDAKIKGGDTVNIGGDFKLEDHPEDDEVQSNDNFDSFNERGDLTGVDFDLWVDIGSDGFTIVIDETTIEPCELDDSDNDDTTDNTDSNDEGGGGGDGFGRGGDGDGNGGGGGGIIGQRTSNRSSNNGGVGGASADPQVLGEQVSAVPLGAANAGAGGGSSNSKNMIAILTLLGLALAVRTRAGRRKLS